MDALGFNVQGQEANGSIILGTDAQSLVTFYTASKLDNFNSELTGQPVYRQIVKMKLIQPGEKDIVDKEIPEGDMTFRRRFPQQWAAFMEGREHKVDGTPLALMFPANPETVATLNAAHIHTIQQLAGLSDTNAPSIMFGVDLREKAKKYLAAVEKGEGFNQLSAKIDHLEADKRNLEKRLHEVESLLAQKAAEPVADQPALFAQFQQFMSSQTNPTEPKRGPGRPKTIQE